MTKQEDLRNCLVFSYGIVGNNNDPSHPNYRLDNPWQRLGAFLASLRDGTHPFAIDHGLVRIESIDRGGSIVLLELERVPTRSGYGIDELAHEFLDHVFALFHVWPEDTLSVVYSDASGKVGHLAKTR